MLLFLVLICASPVLLSYFTYYVVKPRGGSTNYGALVEPQRPIPATLAVRTPNGEIVSMQSFKGKWLMLAVAPSACDQACATKLYFMRQLRVTQGPERDRIQTVWLRTDDKAVPPAVAGAHQDMLFLVADRGALADWLPVDTGTTLEDHIFLVDPNGNLMMRFPKNPDPSKIKRDLAKLLKWSGLG